MNAPGEVRNWGRRHMSGGRRTAIGRGGTKYGEEIHEEEEDNQRRGRRNQMGA